MMKSVGVLIAAMMVAPAPALAAGQAWQLGFTYDCCPYNSNSFNGAPVVKQTVIVQTADGKATVQMVDDEYGGPQVSSLGVNNSVDGPYIVRKPYGRDYVGHWGKRQVRQQFRRGGRHIRVY